MGPLAVSDGCDARGLSDEFVPSVAAVVDDIRVGCEDAVREPVFAHELPDIFDRIEFGAFGGKRQDGDVAGYDQLVGHVPTGLIHEDHGMGIGCDGLSDFGKMQVHRVGIAKGQDKPRTLALRRADRSEDVGRGGSLIMGRRRPRAALGPATRDLVLLADPRLVLEPDLYRGLVREVRPDLCQLGCEAPFLNASSAALS